MNDAESFLKTSLENVKGMVDVDKSIGKPLIIDGGIIIPVSQVKVCFLSGGSEFHPTSKKEEMPFGGVSGGNISINPSGFLVIQNNEMRAISIDSKSTVEDAIINFLPKILEHMKKKK